MLEGDGTLGLEGDGALGKAAVGERFVSSRG
jgi:hypothetical protein